MIYSICFPIFTWRDSLNLLEFIQIVNIAKHCRITFGKVEHAN